MVINHGVPESQMKAMVNMLAGFFDLTEEEKMEFKGKHVLDPIRCGTSFNASVPKAFSRRDFLKVSLHPKFHCPTKPEGFRYVHFLPFVFFDKGHLNEGARKLLDLSSGKFYSLKNAQSKNEERKFMFVHFQLLG